jgi:hypothetical protein
MGPLPSPKLIFPNPPQKAVSDYLNLVLVFGALNGQKANDNGRRGETDHLTRAGGKHHGLIDAEFMTHRRADRTPRRDLLAGTIAGAVELLSASQALG